MSGMFDRREFLAAFLQGAGCFAVAAGLPQVARAQIRGARAAQYHFPQGLASGDPSPDSVVLWTRVEALAGAAPTSVPVTLQVSASPDFTVVVAEQQLTARADADHTVRVVITGLAADTIYFYRFIADGDLIDLVGRTRTAPTPGTDRAVKLAFASCQSYEGGFYGAWRLLLNEDVAKPPAEQLDFVVHLGDFVYEALGYGTARKIEGLPSGGMATGEGTDWADRYAVTLDDYRHLYKTYLADPDLRAARARWPFVVTWDDHEFTDDCWQTVQTYNEPPAPAQERRVAANQAWFEYVPAFLSGRAATNGVTSLAHDFAATTVTNTPLADFDEHGFSREANNVDAVASLTIFRTMQWGKHVQLVVCDNRSYRTRHCIPGEVAKAVGGGARYVLPLEIVRIFDAGRAWNNGNPPESIPFGDTSLPNSQRNAPPGSMLGAVQKEWWKQVMQHSTATWKLWANSVPALPLRLDLGSVDPKASNAVFTIDSWDGYLTERNELMQFIASERIGNVVSLTGDHHANFAGLIADDFDAGTPVYVAAEYAVAGIASQSVFRAFAGAVKDDNPLAPIVKHSAKGAPPGADPLPALNLTLMHGAKSSAVLAETGDFRQAEAARNPAQNPHLRYVDTHAQGIARMTVHADRLECELITVEEPLIDRGLAGARVLRRARFVQQAAPGGAPVQLAEAQVEGTGPYPFRT